VAGSEEASIGQAENSLINGGGAAESDLSLLDASGGSNIVVGQEYDHLIDSVEGDHDMGELDRLLDGPELGTEQAGAGLRVPTSKNEGSITTPQLQPITAPSTPEEEMDIGLQSNPIADSSHTATEPVTQAMDIGEQPHPLEGSSTLPTNANGEREELVNSVDIRWVILLRS